MIDVKSQGPLTAMSETELMHWMRLASVRAAAVAIPKIRTALQHFSARQAAYTVSLEVNDQHACMIVCTHVQHNTPRAKALASLRKRNLSKYSGPCHLGMLATK